MSKARQERRSERQAQRREERSQRKAQGAGSRRNVWLALGGALAIGVVLVGAFAIGIGQEDSATADDTSTSSVAADGTSTANATADGTSTSEGSFPIVAYPAGVAAIGPEERDFTELLGAGAPVVLNFWAGQCPPCRAEMPAFQNVYDTYGDDFLLLGVDIGPFIGLGSNQSAIELLVELGITYPTAQAVDARAVRDYNVLGMPSTIFYDADGVEMGRHSGLLTEDALESRVRELVGA